MSQWLTTIVNLNHGINTMVLEAEECKKKTPYTIYLDTNWKV